MAAAVVDFARTRVVQPQPEKVENFKNFPGEGIYGNIEDNEIYIGNWKIASRAGCNTALELEAAMEGKSVNYVFLGSALVGIFCLSDVCRTGAKEAIEELKSKGIKTVMLTGDRHGAATRAQEQLGGALDIIHAGLLPEDKARIIKELQKEGPTAMIGDGLNDAPALATADIGISMGVSGSALATETGDIILMSNDILRIPKALSIAKNARRKIYENVIISVSIKAAILGLAIGGHPLVWAAVLADVGTCLLVIFNSMLLLQGTGLQGQKRHRSKSQGHVHKSKCGSTTACSSHDHKSPCCDIEAQTKCGSGCGSSDSSSSSSGKHHGGHGDCHPHDEDMGKDQRCCGNANHDSGSRKVIGKSVHKHESCRTEDGVHMARELEQSKSNHCTKNCCGNQNDGLGGNIGKT